MANLSTAQATRQAVSAQWALNQLGAKNYYNLCQRFVENAYGTQGRYGSAAQASNALMTNTDMGEADVGDLVFFRPDPSNGNYGHVGIYVGNGEMVSATNSGITRDNITSGYWNKLLVGFGDPPDQWQGRAADQNLLQGAADLVMKGSAAVGDAGRAVKARAVSTWGGAGQWINEIAAAAEKYDIPVNLLAAKVNVESGGNPNATSPAGAKGLLQLMPGTARGLGVTDINDPVQNLDAGAKYFRQMYDRTGDWDDALRAYNAGPAGNWNNTETVNHVKKVNQWADQIGEAMDRGAGSGSGGPGSGFSGAGGAGGRLPGETAADQRARERQRQQASQFADFWSKINQLGDAGAQAVAQGAGAVGGALGALGGARDQFVQQRPGLGPLPGALGGAAGAVGGALGGLGNAWQQRQDQIRAQNEARNRQSGQAAGIDAIRGLFGGGGAAGGAGGTPGVGPGAAGMPGTPGGAPGGGPPGGGDIIDPTTGAPVNRSTAAPAGAPGQPGGPAAERKRPAGYVDPATITNPAYMGIIGQWNSALEAAQIAQERVNNAASEEDRVLAQRGLDKANELVRGLAPTAANIIQAAEKEEGGQFAPGTSAKQKKFTIVRRNPETGKWETQVIDNPAWEEDAAIQSTRESNRGALERQNAADAAALQRAREEMANRLGISQAEIASRERISQGEIASRENIAGINATTSRVTTALNAAIQQRSQDIEAAIRSGDLSLREATEQFNQWYKQNVEAPLAILQQQRETERYKVERENAITTRATAKAEHERGMANIGQQMWGQAAQAYNQMIPLTVGEGWGQGFQKNLAAGAGGYTPNTGATYNVPESLDQFATRKVAEMLKGVSPYADSILAAGGQGTAIGASNGVGTEYERSGPINAQGMDQLRDTAVGTAQNALNNPFVMPSLPQFNLPGQIDIGGMAGAGMDGNLTAELDRYIPRYGGGGAPDANLDGYMTDNVDWTKLLQGVS